MFNKVPSSSPNLTEENIEALKQLFPEIITDGGKINFDKLKVLLGESVDTGREKYEFTWPGKQEMMQGLQVPSKATLKVDEQSSKNMKKTKNLYIEGDNLEVLKTLQKSYHNKVKMIYIDPPYNTGEEFIYPDDYKEGVEQYLKLTEQVNADGLKLMTNPNKSGRLHSNWLNMIYPRLYLSRKLLSNDGVIMVSIDDNEVSNLKNLMNTIYGEHNFIAQLVIDTNSSKNNAKLIGVSHEYVLVYSKNKEALQGQEWKTLKNNAKEFKQYINRMIDGGLTNQEIEKELKHLVKYPRFYDFDHYYYYDHRGVYRTDNPGGVKNGNLKTEIIHPITQKKCKKPSGGWRYTKETIQEMLRQDLWHFGEDEHTIPTPKRYLHDYMYEVPKSILLFDSQISTKYLKKEKLFFDYPKPVDLIKYLSTLINDDEALILDFFSGSATTAHAVMKLNAEDGGNRQFIMVQLPEPTDEKSEAYKAGYKNICEIGKERIRRAGEQILEEHPEAVDRLDVGFKVLKLDSSNIREWNVEFDQLEDEIDLFADTFVDGAREIDIVHEIMLKTGLELTLPIDTFEVDGKNVYDIAYGNLFICLADEINEAVVHAIIERRRTYDIETSTVVLKDTGFANNDSEKLNCFELLKDAGYQDDQLMTI